MFIRRFALFLLLMLVSLFAADSTISVSLQAGKQSAHGSEITVVMTNTTVKPLKVLTWRTPLETPLTADIFSITQKGKAVAYSGVLVKRSAPTDADYTLFQPGESRSITIDLSRYYRMEIAGEYAVSYRGAIRTVPGTSGKAAMNTADVPAATTSRIISKPLLLYVTPVEKKTVDAKLPAEFEQCSAGERTTLNSAHDAAIVIAGDATGAMNNAPVPTAAPRYMEWFGMPDASRHNTVKTHYANVFSALDTEQVTFSCDCTAVPDPDNTYAYVYPNQPYTIHICGAFWNAPLTGTDSQAGTIVHETTHFIVVAGTDDYVYGQAGCRSLADTAPEEAVMNADSHEYFAENTPFLSMEEPSGFMITGTVTDAGSESPIPNALVRLSGDGTGSTYSSGSGSYAFTSLEAGSYTVTAALDGYDSDAAATAITDSNQVVNLALTAGSSAPDYSVELSWGDSAYDLDTRIHVAALESDGCYQTVYWGNDTVFPYASLDSYDTTSPVETATISELSATGSHEYWVHSYSGAPISASGATVRVYRGATLLKTYTVPAGTGDPAAYWHVFDIGTGGIRDINALEETETATCARRGNAVIPAIFLLID